MAPGPQAPRTGPPAAPRPAGPLPCPARPPLPGTSAARSPALPEPEPRRPRPAQRRAWRGGRAPRTLPVRTGASVRSGPRGVHSLAARWARGAPRPRRPAGARAPPPAGPSEAAGTRRTGCGGRRWTGAHPVPLDAPTSGPPAGLPPPAPRGRWNRRPQPRVAGRKPYSALTVDLPRVPLGAHAAAQLLPAHADLELQRGRDPEGAAPLGHRHRPGSSRPRLAALLTSQTRANPRARRGRGSLAALRGIGPEPGKGRGSGAARLGIGP